MANLDHVSGLQERVLLAAEQALGADFERLPLADDQDAVRIPDAGVFGGQDAFGKSQALGPRHTRFSDIPAKINHGDTLLLTRRESSLSLRLCFGFRGATIRAQKQ